MLFSLSLLVAGSAHAGVVVNEVMPNPAGSDDDAEWIELHNDGSSSVSLDGWSIEVAKSTWSSRHTFSGTSIPAGGYLLIGESLVSGADVVVSNIDMGNAGSNGDGVRLVDDGDQVVDTVIYGANNDDGLIDDTQSQASSLAPKPPDGMAIARSPDGADTDASGDDFTLDSGTPGASNPTAAACAPSGNVKLNEFVANPAGSDSVAMAEWVELYNGGGSTVQLAGWSIETITSSDWSVKATLTSGDQIGGGGYFVIGEANVSAADVEVSSFGLPSGSSGDGIRLVDCNGTVVDTVVYGNNNSDAIVDDTGSVAGSLAPQPGDDEAVARITDGGDTDQCGVDWAIAGVNTPGSQNPAPPTCEAGGSVVINELLPNPEGTDSPNEWVELYNAGSSVSLAGWSIATQTKADSNPSAKYTFGDGASIGSSSWLLVGESGVAGADHRLEEGRTLSLPNASSGADAVLLRDCNGDVVDTIIYGSDNSEDALRDDRGQVASSIAPKPGDNLSLARTDDGVDTDDSGVDFAATEELTPGAANPEPPPCTPDPGGIVINEILTDPEGSDGDAGTEFVEIYNAGSAALALDGWGIVAAGQSGDFDPDILLPRGASIDAEGFYVAGGALVSIVDLITEVSLPNGSNGDAIKLVDCEGTVVDVVIYGDNNDDALEDEAGNVGENNPKPGSNQALARIEDGVDSNSTDDWFIDLSATPGETNYQERVENPGGGGGAGGGCGRNNAPDGDAPNGQGCSTVPDRGLWAVLGVLGVLVRRRRR